LESNFDFRLISGLENALREGDSIVAAGKSDYYLDFATKLAYGPGAQMRRHSFE
jgi:hypothetical protein